VDDDEAILDLITQTLDARRYQVDAVRSCEDALPRILSRDYHGILLDLILPDSNGLALFRQIRRQRPALEQRVIFLTGALDEERVKRFRRVAGDRLLLKPFDLMNLTEMVRSVVSAPRA